MKIMIVEEDAKERSAVEKMVTDIQPEADIKSFDSSLAALAEARENEYDAAIIDTVMQELGGTDLGQYLKELYPYINLIFASKKKDSGYAALALHASGYLLRPVKETDLKREFDDLRYPEERKRHKRVFAQTFGNFELFVDGKPVQFKYSRTKEIVALLVNNRGAQTTNGEIIASLWEDDGDPEKKTSYLSNLRQDLQNTLSRLKLSGIITKQRGSMAIVPDKIECDLFDWLANGENSKYHYLGDYMNQYSWPEYRHAELDEISYAMYDE